jgi:hypothetical protein
LSEKHLSEEQMLSIDTANLVLLFMSEDFLASSGCMTVAERAIAGQEMWGLTTQAVLLHSCNLGESRLAQVKVIPEGSVAHRSIYAQEQRILDVAKAIRKLLANVLIAGQYIGQMNLLQWLLWLLYGSGSASCPYFVVGDYALKYVRPAGFTGVLIHVLDLKNSRIVAEHVVGSHTNADFSDLLHSIAPSNSQSETVQGIALRDKPLIPIQK